MAVHFNSNRLLLETKIWTKYARVTVQINSPHVWMHVDRIHHAHQHAIAISLLAVMLVHATLIVLMGVMDRASIHCVPVSLQHFQQPQQNLLMMTTWMFWFWTIMSQQTIRKWSISNVKNKMTFFSSKKEIQTFNTDVRQNSVESFGPLEDVERHIKIR